MSERQRLTLSLRIVVQDPIPDLEVALQSGAAAKTVLRPAASASAGAVVSELEVVVDGSLPDGQRRLLAAPASRGRPRHASSTWAWAAKLAGNMRNGMAG